MQTISGYAAQRPRVKALSGKVAKVSYDDQTHIFTAEVHPGDSQQATIKVSAR
jgi:hypothetical protein